MEIELLSVIVPVYKKEKTIKQDIEDLYEVLKDSSYKYEIIVVVDGINEDKSYKILKKLKTPKTKVYGLKHNRGKGLAVRYGMTKTKGDIVAFLDGGGDIRPEGLILMLEHMKWYNADIIVASKLHSASKTNNYPLLKTRFYYLLTKLLFWLKIRDTQTGLKAYKRSVLEAVLDKLVIKTFAFDIEVLAISKYLGFNNIYDSPVEIVYDKTQSSINYFSSTSFYKSTIRMVFNTLAIWYRMHILKYYDDGRKRVKVYDKELDMYINTGAMTDNRQRLIDLTNKIYSILPAPQTNEKKK